METSNGNSQTKWTMDMLHSEIGFKVRHLMISHTTGKFKIFEANIYTAGNDFKNALVDVWIDAASISTGDDKRDAHLKSKDFFDAEVYKQISFTSNMMKLSSTQDSFDMWGILTMKGISKRIKLNAQFGGIVKDPWGNEKAGFTITGKINRTDWGLIWNSVLENTGLMVGEDVNILCEIELVNAGQKDLTMELIADNKATSEMI
nr:YceI family protein [Bacteroidota bacterium]